MAFDLILRILNVQTKFFSFFFHCRIVLSLISDTVMEMELFGYSASELRLDKIFNDKKKKFPSAPVFGGFVRMKGAETSREIN